LNKEPRLDCSLLQLLWSYPDQLNPNSLITELGALVMSAKLFVGNLASSTTSDEIRRLFAVIGAVQSCNLITDRATGQSKGFGFVEMDSVDSAEAAKEELNGLDVHGRMLTVKNAKPQTKRRERVSSRRY
jgi:RNA recognition motif-containing protein